jgi:hypothetical protein
MEIKLDPKLVRAAKRKTEDVEKLANRLLKAWLRGAFFPKEDVAVMVKVAKPYRVEREEIADMFDEATQEFRGVAIVGRSVSETLWVPSPTLHDALKENDTVLVLKTPRKNGIRTVEGEQIYAWLPEEDDVN